ncbi:hypothetical protein PR202_gb20960 [Eleusine coracana subsp. coracana]|uniref:J domain-containing protein n=1 Tax=Eleusine coracana subsp. coracana TaxID=191504 RepID=A0AAV5FC38_ELECO|nr:hypothetical protein PR202_gb20960 [Eleusine coracana subsp. coracana]
MECNKEEASRAKDLAALKLQGGDYVGAKRIALKAQQLYPGLESISQLLAVCEVHWCAALKINGETDWYGILQVETTADDKLLKKQYHKLALLLHPDKNKYAGAEAAFKLIGEAHMILTDQVKRLIHDSKRKSVVATSASVPKKRGRPPNKADHVARKANKENNDAPDRWNKPQQHAGGFSGSTFWTICLSCGTKYQYPYSLVMKVLLCQICSRSFLAYELSNKAPKCSGSGMQQQMFTPGHQGHSTNLQDKYRGQQNPVNSHHTPVTGFGVQQKKFPPSQVHATNQQHKYVPGRQNPMTGLGAQQKMFTPNQQQHSENVPDKQIPASNNNIRNSISIPDQRTL